MKHIFISAILLISLQLFSQHDEWRTYYEKSGFTATPDYAASIEFSKKLAAASPMIEYTTFGVSPQGRDLPLMIIDANGNFTPESIRGSGHAVLFIEAGIHSGEIEGKDAMFLFLRDLVVHEKHRELLENVSIVFIPIFNVDGHERSGSYGRINQNGPEEMGWRTTAQNLNLNRDFLKADAPEMKAWLKLFNKWLPDFFMDVHTTDGADYQYALTYQMETEGNMDPELTAWARDEYLPEMKKEMAEAGFPVFQYVAFRTWFDPRTGLRNGVAGPRYSQGYTALQNRTGLLVETHMLKPYKNRVESTLELIKITLEIMNRDHEELINLNKQADEYAMSSDFRKTPFALRWERSDEDSVMVDFKGVEYDVIKSDLTGGPWFIYHKDKPKDFKLPYFYKMNVTDSVMLPEAYVIPPQWLDIIERLELHGVEYYRLEDPREINIQSLKFENPEWRRQPYEGRHPMTNVEYELLEEKIVYPEGSLIIPMDQRRARVIAHMFEPLSEDSFLQWGFFDAIFEQKEYAETYVMEKVAREMIKEDPQLMGQFEAWKEANPQMAQNQWLQLNWFYQRSLWWDNKKDVYPVGRIMDSGQLR